MVQTVKKLPTTSTEIPTSSQRIRFSELCSEVNPPTASKAASRVTVVVPAARSMAAVSAVPGSRATAVMVSTWAICCQVPMSV